MKKLTIFIASALLLTSCNSFLDTDPTDRVSSKVMWSKTEYAEYAVNYLYSYIWDFNSSPTVAGLTEALTDEMKYVSYNYNALCFIPSEISYGGNNLDAGYVDSYLGYWSTIYTAIRKTNEALSNLHAYGTLDEDDTKRIEGELRFLRAYFYFELVKRYKDVIIYDEDLTAIDTNTPLSSEELAWDFIQTDLNYAAENLPLPGVANGRLNQGTAYAMLTRTMLYAKRYDAVIAAADKVTELGYELEANYADVFTKTTGNKEAILQYLFSQADGVTHEFNFYYTPGGDYAVVNQKGGGYGVPTQEIVESYELATGGKPDWSKWHGTTTDNPPYELL